MIRCLLLFLLWTADQVSGSLQETEQYIGLGYNLLSGNPDGGEWSKLGSDPGPRYSYRILQDHTNGTNYVKSQHLPYCNNASSTMIFFGGQSYQKYLLKYFTFTDNTTLNSYAFTVNQLYKDINHRALANKDVFRDEIVSCVAEHAHFYLPPSSLETNLVTPEFAQAVCKLPVNYDAVIYKQFLHTWGTHVTIEVDTGHRQVTRYRQSPTDIADVILSSHDTSTHAAILREEFYEQYGSVIELNLQRFQHSDYQRVSSGTKIATFNLGSGVVQVPISWTLMPIFDVLTDEYWQNFQELFMKGLCHSSLSQDLQQYKANLKTALLAYPSQVGAEIPQNEILKIPITWPTGTYGLMRPVTDCPTDPAGFTTGWVTQDSEDSNNANHWTSDNHLKGPFGHGYLTTWFCMKQSTVHGDYDRDWPSGNYCILMSEGSCPNGFRSGEIKMDDEDHNNGNKHGGVLPDGSYGRDTIIKYCCRQDGNYQTPILLPVDKPFYLMRYSSPCQEVLGMHVVDEFVKFDTEDHNNENHCIGANPHNSQSCGGDIELHYCYYSRSNSSPIKLNGIFG